MEPADGRLPPPVADRRGLLRVHADEQDVGEGDGAAAAGGQGEAGGAAAGAGRHNSIEKALPKSNVLFLYTRANLRVRKQGVKYHCVAHSEKGQNWISVLSILARGLRIGFQYCQFWPMGRELDFSTFNSGPWGENWI